MKYVILAMMLSSLFITTAKAQNSAGELKDYAAYSFIPGEKILFEDNLQLNKLNADPFDWNIEGGEAKVEEDNYGQYVSIKKYYTRLSPKLKAKLPAEFTIEYDAWLDAGYDGNPGIEIHLLDAAEQEVVITPNAAHVSCRYPGGEENGDTPEAIRGENFYNKWNHVAIMYSNKSLKVYINQFNMFSIADCKVNIEKIIITGNTSQEMKILFKNFRLAKDIPGIAKDLDKGLLITHGIKFDVNKFYLKAESMGVLNQVADFLKKNPLVKLEIGGHTDSDGDDNANLILSQLRADAVKSQLVKMGISESKLTTKGYGETKPLAANTTGEGKAANRRVEFKKI